jgi:hypothetical protein
MTEDELRQLQRITDIQLLRTLDASSTSSTNSTNQPVQGSNNSSSESKLSENPLNVMSKAFTPNYKKASSHYQIEDSPEMERNMLDIQIG